MADTGPKDSKSGSHDGADGDIGDSNQQPIVVENPTGEAERAAAADQKQRVQVLA